jgi:hypothetical protein
MFISKKGKKKEKKKKHMLTTSIYLFLTLLSACSLLFPPLYIPCVEESNKKERNKGRR